MQTRVPRIARDLLEKNRTLGALERDAVERLAVVIETNQPLPAPQPPAPDVQAWSEAHAEHAGERWLDGEWFHAELAFYRAIAEACRFWQTGRDPFEPIKEEELAGERPWRRLGQALAVRGDRESRLAELLDACLWGNRVDLSYTVAAAREHRHDDDLLVDDRQAAMPLLVQPGCHAHLVADNAGVELAV
ncbi:MAG TPA: ARMT1-like domain-containing protein, partial [Polyangiaceae bacterium]